jgi:hypothetical protein
MGLPTFTDIISLSNKSLRQLLKLKTNYLVLISRKLLVKILSHMK